MLVERAIASLSLLMTMMTSNDDSSRRHDMNDVTSRSRDDLPDDRHRLDTGHHSNERTSHLIQTSQHAGK